MSSHDLATPFHRAASVRHARHRNHLHTVLALCTLFVIGHAQAGSSGNLALTSDYVFRGISQSNQHPALQAGIEQAADNGLYVGAWGSNVSWLADTSSSAAPISSSLELDAYAGWRGIRWPLPICLAMPTRMAAAISTSAPPLPLTNTGALPRMPASSGFRTTPPSPIAIGSWASPVVIPMAWRWVWPIPARMPITRCTPIPMATRWPETPWH